VRLAAALLAACLLQGAPQAQAVKASVEAEVAATTWKTIRLRGLPKGGSLAVHVETTGPISVLLLHESQVARFPRPVRPAFAASLDRRLSFRVTLPVAGTYYVVLDNRKGTDARSIKILIEALRPARKPSPKPKGQTELEAI
jgi:hypothetical protein